MAEDGTGTEPQAQNEGYAYWHKGVGSQAPTAQPKLLASETIVGNQVVEKSIDSFGFLDDDDAVKVYITLDGDLAGATNDAVDAQFAQQKGCDEFCMDIKVQGTRFCHRLAADRLAGSIKPEQCKCVASKKGDKMIVTLRKRDKRPWSELRAKVTLPYRRGGGGDPL